MDPAALAQAGDAQIIASVIDPLMLAAVNERAFFAALPAPTQGLIALWVLAVQVQRNGALYFVEDDPDWLVRHVPAACAQLDEPAIGARLAALIPTLRPGRWRERLRVPAAQRAECDAIDREVMERGLTERLLLWVRAHLSELVTDAARAADKLDKVRSAVDEEREQRRRARWDAARAVAVPWSRGHRFAVGDALRHETLGLGQVTALREPDKIVVEFEDGKGRTLLHAPAPRR